MRINSRIFLIMVTSAIVAACGGGGGGGGGAGNGNGGGSPPVADTFTVSITAIEMTDTRTGLAVDASGLPIRGATVTVE